MDFGFESFLVAGKKLGGFLVERAFKIRLREKEKDVKKDIIQREPGSPIILCKSRQADIAEKIDIWMENLVYFYSILLSVINIVWALRSKRDQDR